MGYVVFHCKIFISSYAFPFFLISLSLYRLVAGAQEWPKNAIDKKNALLYN